MTTLVAQPPRIRTQGQRQVSLAIAHQRLMVLMLIFMGLTAVIAGRIMILALSSGSAQAMVAPADQNPTRGDIVDRNGEVLARTIGAWSIGVHTDRLLNTPESLASGLARLMPEHTEAEYLTILKSGVRFTYLRRRALPDLVAQVNALGEPAMAYAREPERLYPQTTLGAHVLGYTNIDGHGVSGMERAANSWLTNPQTRNQPLALAMDTRVQAVMETELSNAMVQQRAKGATGLVLDVHTGEILALVSLPVFNPNNLDAATEDERRNNVTQSVYELGSAFKPITIANAIDSGVVTSMARRYDATAPIKVGAFTIHDDEPAGRWFNVPELLIHSSNIATARIAQQLGAARQAAIFKQLHFDAPPTIELVERGRPIWPTYWSEATIMTVGFGHGISVTPLHLASAYAALVNGGIWRPATLMKLAPGKAPPGSRVFSQSTSDRIRQLLRLIVLQGTGRKADAAGFRVGGKTGTAEKHGEHGYSKHANISTFVAAFPIDAPKYVVLAMLDEPQGSAQSGGQRTAGLTVAPVVGKVVSRIGPMLGIMPNMSRDIDISDLTPLIWKPKGER